MKKIIVIIFIILVLTILGGSFYIYTINQEKKLEELLVTVDERVEMDKLVSEKAKTFTLSEIAMHNTKSDCWMSINGKVVDVTNFISMHPGGDNILKGCGADASSYFNRVPSHLKGIAQKLLEKYKIGDLSK
jgi:cytochrome b involved in lipid metabolism